jgi:hypothetical protein
MSNPAVDQRGPSGVRVTSRTASRCPSTWSAAPSTQARSTGMPGGSAWHRTLQQIAAVETGGLGGQAGGSEQVLGELVDRRRGRHAGAVEDGLDHLAGVVSGPRARAAQRSRSVCSGSAEVFRGPMARHAACAASGPDRPAARKAWRSAADG